jgi:hypothetical protein
MRKGAWCINLAAAGLVLVILTCGGCTRTREIEVGDVVRLNCPHPEWGRMVEETDTGTFEITLMTGPDINAEIAGAVPCGHEARITRIHESEIGTKEYEVQTIVDGNPVRGWLWSLTLEDDVELERLEK